MAELSDHNSEQSKRGGEQNRGKQSSGRIRAVADLHNQICSLLDLTLLRLRLICMRFPKSFITTRERERERDQSIISELALNIFASVTQSLFGATTLTHRNLR